MSDESALITNEHGHLEEANAALQHLLEERLSSKAGAGDAHVVRALTDVRVDERSALERARGRPFFGVIKNDAGRELRLGPASIRSRDNRVLVSNWRAEAAKDFYLATHDDRRGQGVRRRVAIRDGVVINVEEERLDGADTDNESRAAAIRDAASATKGRMAEIVATIQPEQYSIISMPPGGVLGVQGGPGTGKSAVALHRAAWLLYRYADLRSGGMLFVGAGCRFLEFISDVLPALGEDAVDQLVANRVMFATSFRSETNALARLKGDARISGLLRCAVERRIAPRGPETIAFTVGATRRRYLPATSRRRSASLARNLARHVGNETISIP